MKWSDLEKRPQFAALSNEGKRAARAKFFNDFVKPSAPEGVDVDSLRSKWMGADYGPEQSTWERAKDIGRDVLQTSKGALFTGTAHATEYAEREGGELWKKLKFYSLGSGLIPDEEQLKDMAGQLTENSTADEIRAAYFKSMEGAKQRLNKPFEASEPTKFLRDYGEVIGQDISRKTQKAVEDSQITGDARSPSSWNFGTNPSLTGLAFQGVRTFGEMAPIVAVSALTRPLSLAKQMGVGVTMAGLQAGGAAAHEEQKRIMTMKIEELRAVPAFRELVKGGLSEDEARGKLAHESALVAGRVAAPIGGASGAVISGLVSSQGQKAIGAGVNKALQKIAPKHGDKLVDIANSRAVRGVVGGVGGGISEGFTETGEGVSARTATNQFTGETRDAWKDSAGEFIMGGLVGKTTGLASGLLTPSSVIQAKKIDARQQKVDDLKKAKVAAVTPEDIGTLDAKIALAEASLKTEVKKEGYYQTKKSAVQRSAAEQDAFDRAKLDEGLARLDAEEALPQAEQPVDTPQQKTRLAQALDAFYAAGDELASRGEWPSQKRVASIAKNISDKFGVTPEQLLTATRRPVTPTPADPVTESPPIAAQHDQRVAQARSAFDADGKAAIERAGGPITQQEVSDIAQKAASEFGVTPEQILTKQANIEGVAVGPTQSTGQDFATSTTTDAAPWTPQDIEAALDKDFSNLSQPELKIVAEQLRTGVLTSYVGGEALPTQNLTAYTRAQKAGKAKAFVAFIDGDSFKGINDKYGHGAGDAVIRGMSQMLAEAGGVDNAFHRSGDEFFLQGDSHEGVDSLLKKVQAELRGAEFDGVNKDGQKVTFSNVGFSYGIGSDTTTAENNQTRDKERRAELGLRGDRRQGPESAGNDRLARVDEGYYATEGRVGTEAEPEATASIAERQSSDHPFAPEVNQPDQVKAVLSAIKEHENAERTSATTRNTQTSSRDSAPQGSGEVQSQAAKQNTAQGIEDSGATQPDGSDTPDAPVQIKYGKPRAANPDAASPSSGRVENFIGQLKVKPAKKDSETPFSVKISPRQKAAAEKNDGVVPLNMIKVKQSIDVDGVDTDIDVSADKAIGVVKKRMDILEKLLKCARS